METIKVSVCIASFNGMPYIEEQVTSILGQLPENSELIISDDGSTDGTLEYLERVRENDSRVVILKGPRKGIAKNFELSLSHSTGCIIFLSDQDDIWYPGRLNQAIKLHQKYDLVVVNADIIDKHGNKVLGKVYSKEKKFSSFGKVLVKNEFVGCLMSFNKGILKESLPFPKKVPMHDWWIALIALHSNCKVYLEPDSFIGYRRHGNNFSETTGRSKYSLVKMAMFRIRLVLGILKWKLTRAYYSMRT